MRRRVAQEIEKRKEMQDGSIERLKYLLAPWYMRKRANDKPNDNDRKRVATQIAK
jgi:hypothetical protein